MSLYNGMIHPLAPFPLAGAIWYQGEGNVSRAFEYRTLFPAMIRSWREAWGDEFWFLFVLLAGYGGLVTEAGESQIAELRDAQLAALAFPRTAAASAILCDWARWLAPGVPVTTTAPPTDEWVAQQLREATPFGEKAKHLICDVR
jgi:Lon protease-like protein